MKNILYISIALIFSCYNGYAQFNIVGAFNSGGLLYQNSNVQYSYSIGNYLHPTITKTTQTNIIHNIYQQVAVIDNFVKEDTHVGKFEITAYPNPAHNCLTAKIITNEEINNFIVKVYDVTGKQMPVDLTQENSFYLNTLYFDIKDLPSGYYFVTIFTDTNRSAGAFKFIKN